MKKIAPPYQLIVNDLNEYIMYLKKALKTGYTFFLSKAVAFLAPLLVVKFVSMADFGFLEFCFATGSTISRFSQMGLPASYPYFILQKKEYNREPFFYIICPILFVLSLVVTVLYVIGFINMAFYGVYLFAAIYTLQMLYSSILKSKDLSFIAVLLDSGYYYLLGLFLLCKLFFEETPLSALFYIMATYLTILCLYGVYRDLKFRTKSFFQVIHDNYKPVLKFGILASIGGALMYLLTCCSRIYLERFLSYEAVGEFSLYFRFMGIPEAFMSFLYIAFFKKLYLSDGNFLDKYYCVIGISIFVLCLLSITISPYAIQYLSHDIVTINYGLMFMLASYMPIWAVISYVEGLVYRENETVRLIIILSTVSVIFLAVLYVIKDILDLNKYTMLFILSVGISFITLARLLTKKNIHLNLTTKMVVFMLALNVFTYVIKYLNII